MPKVIVLEDNCTLRSLLTTLLEMEGYQVQAFAEIQLDEILPRFKQERPQALLLDVFSNNINGLDVLQTLRKSKEFKKLPVLMTSGMDVGEKCMQAGATGFLLKPFTPDELTTWLREKIKHPRSGPKNPAP